MSQHNVDNILTEFGFTQAELSVYKAGLEVGSRPASIVAQRAGFKRGHTYNILALLQQKGIVQEFVKNSVKHFTFSPPQALVAMLENQEQQLAAKKQRLLDAIPVLERLRNPIASDPKVKFYQGLEGVKEIFEDMIRTPNQPIYGVVDFAKTWCLSPEHEGWIRSFIAKRQQRNVWWYGIVNKSPVSDIALSNRQSAKREVKMIEGFELGAEINIYGSKIAIKSTAEETIGIVVDHEATAQTLRSLHQTIWHFLPEYVSCEESELFKIRAA